MSATVHSLDAAIRERDLHARLKRVLKERFRLELRDAALSRVENYDLYGRGVLLIKRRSSQSFVIIGSSHEGVLLGNEPLRTLSMPLTMFRSAGSALHPILSCGSFDGITVTYFGNELGVLVRTELLYGRHRSL